MKAKIVQFENGKYAIRRGWWIFKRYADLDELRECEDNIYWWRDPDNLHYCTTPSFTDIESIVKNYNNYKTQKTSSKKEKEKAKVLQTITLK